MTWRSEDRYIRNMLDGREKWGTALSLTAVAILFKFLSEHSYRIWVNLTPLMIGLYGTLFVLVADCYYKQAEAIGAAKDEQTKEIIKGDRWWTFAFRIGFFGWLHIIAPLTLGVLATLALCCGKM